LNHPEFRETVFVGMPPESIHDQHDGEFPWQKDIAATRGFLKFLNKQSTKPKFGFLFLDGTHGPYSYDADRFTKFQPVDAQYFLAFDPKGQIKALFNAYRNSILQADDTLKETLNELTSRYKFAKSRKPIVVITADHGEEFLEHEFRGHSSAFTVEQTRVPMIIRGHINPTKPEKFSHMTSHADLVSTLLRRIGVKNTHAMGVGHELTDTKRKYTLSCGWDQCALISSYGFTVFGAEPYNAMRMERRDASYKINSDNQTKDPYLTEALREMSRFY